jgi:hypothetical protein
MKDREQNQHETVNLPPIWCSGICRNAMNEICVEDCAIKRDCSAFEPLKGLKLADLPRFPKTTDMTREEKFTSVTIYLAKIVDHLQGVEDESTTIRRPNTYSTPSRSLSPIVQVKDILPDLTKAISTSEVREERSSERIRSDELAKSAD